MVHDRAGPARRDGRRHGRGRRRPAVEHDRGRRPARRPHRARPAGGPQAGVRPAGPGDRGPRLPADARPEAAGALRARPGERARLVPEAGDAARRREHRQDRPDGRRGSRAHLAGVLRRADPRRGEGRDDRTVGPTGQGPIRRGPRADHDPADPARQRAGRRPHHLRAGPLRTRPRPVRDRRGLPRDRPLPRRTPPDERRPAVGRGPGRVPAGTRARSTRRSPRRDPPTCAPSPARWRPCAAGPSPS